jgi:hypothetical protein
MSPTSYQAAPPRTTTIAEARTSVKSAQTAGELNAETLSLRTGKRYHWLYGEPSNGETLSEFECTLTIPVLV